MRKTGVLGDVRQSQDVYPGMLRISEKSQCVSRSLQLMNELFCAGYPESDVKALLSFNLVIRCCMISLRSSGLEVSVQEL